MSHKTLWTGVGLLVTAVSVFLFARFWNLAGTESSQGGTGILTNLDWGSFFISPLLFAGGVTLMLWATVSGRRRAQVRAHRQAHGSRRARAAAASATLQQSLAQQRALESTH